MEFVKNICFGGFGLSDEAKTELEKLGWSKEKIREIRENIKLRCHKDVIKIVKKLGRKANGSFAELVIVNIPNTVKISDLCIEDYDGQETIEKKHRCW